MTNTVAEPSRLFMRRRTFLGALLGGSAGLWLGAGCSGGPATPPTGISIPDVAPGEDLLAYISRQRGAYDHTLFQQLIGAANAFKEGDLALGLSAADEASRHNARQLLANTRVGDLAARPLFQDALYAALQADLDNAAAARVAPWTLAELKRFVLTAPEVEIKGVMGGLSSDVIACLVKLLNNQELIAVGQKVFNPLPGSNIGQKGYMGARVQPNSPTDNVEDIVWQVLNGFAYAVGDVVLGCNPVSSDPDSVKQIELALKGVVQSFGLTDIIPHCVLAHIDVQAEVEKNSPGATALWFQSLAGSVAANATFDVTTEKMLAYAATRSGRYGLYFETGQGADFTNGHGQDTDMVVHESRKYGFARLLTHQVAEAQRAAGKAPAPWVHVNDVAGFIGPEVFRTREQLVRCCLEDIVMGKLHGIAIGLDICSTLHMDVSLDDLDWCIDQIMPANPAYLMGLPTKNDPMLSYLTTGYQDHVRIREKFGYKVDDRMWAFFQQLGVIDAQGQPTARFGDVLYVYRQLRRKQGDARPDAVIDQEGKEQMARVRARGVWLAEGYGQSPGQLEPKLDAEIHRIYEDAKRSLWAEVPRAFQMAVPGALLLQTQSRDRTDYILHPDTGERFHERSVQLLQELRQRRGPSGDGYDVQIVISDGLNSFAITDQGHLEPFLQRLLAELTSAGYRPAAEPLFLTSGRVRAGYRAGELLFGGLTGDAARHRGIIHVIGERPGSGHHAFSTYTTAPPVRTWSERGKVDHNITKVVSGIALTALLPEAGARETVRLLTTLAPRA